MSCKKQDHVLVERKEELRLTSEQQKQAKVLEQTMFITAAVFSEPAILKKYVEAVKQKIENKPWEEEAISFKELFDTSSTSKYLSLAKDFSRAFVRAYKLGEYPHSDHYPRSKSNELSGIQPRNESLSAATPISNSDDLFRFEDGRQIYFPYSEDLSTQVASLGYTNEMSTYSTHPIIREDYNNGYKYIRDMVCVYKRYGL